MKRLSDPDTYSIIGFDNFPLGYYVTQKLTIIAQDIDQALFAVKTLFHHIAIRLLRLRILFWM